eukprot:sb/3474782/
MADEQWILRPMDHFILPVVHLIMVMTTNARDIMMVFSVWRGAIPRFDSQTVRFHARRRQTLTGIAPGKSSLTAPTRSVRLTVLRIKRGLAPPDGRQAMLWSQGQSLSQIIHFPLKKPLKLSQKDEKLLSKLQP